MARALTAALALAGLALPAAADPPAAASKLVDDAALVCPEVIMRPATAAAKLAALGFEEKESRGLGPGWTVRNYQRRSTGGDMTNVLVTSKRFADATMQSCQYTIMGGGGALDVAALRRHLEADPDIGKLDGDLAADIKNLTKQPPDYLMGYFKRPGSAPVLTIFVNKSARFAIVSVSRVDLVPKR